MTAALQRAARPSWVAAAPLIFVLMWSTGHIGTRLGTPYVEPFTFLAWRFEIATALMLLIAVVSRAPWPSSGREAAHIIVAGLLLHAVYLGGVFLAIGLGMTTGVLALITGAQPLLVAVVVGQALGERVMPRQWLGFMLGFGGIAMVLWDKLSFGGLGAGSVAAALTALLGITAGAVYQKRFCPDLDLRSGTAIQLGVAALAVGVCASILETRVVAVTGELVFAVGWQVIVLSACSYGLMYYLLRRGEAARVSSLFYLCTPLTAIMGYAMFDEALGATALAGMGIAVAGVWMVNR